MRPARTVSLATVGTLALLLAAAPADALVDAPGGVPAPPPAAHAHRERHERAHRGSAARARPRPAVSRLHVPRTAPAGSPPRVTLRIVEHGVARVYVRVDVSTLATHRTVLAASLGWVRTGRTAVVRWPSGATLAPGRYRVSVSARDRRGAGLRRSAHSSGRTTLVVTAPTAPPAQSPPSPAPAPAAPAPPPAGVPTPAQTLADGAVFPVAGAYDFGGPENAFGAPRSGHVHEGQDVLTAEGTPVVAPLPGTILRTSYQAEGAGYYAVEHTAIGLDFTFAHCQAGSLAVGAGEAVAAGQLLCAAGQTGDATAPHLYFEIWVGGWYAVGGYPIDPLPYLEAWAA